MGIFRFLFAPFLLILFEVVAGAQGVRASYLFYRRGLSEGKYAVQQDMKLDYYGHRSAFYCERDYLIDSLWYIAFNEHGGIEDQSAYDTLKSIRIGTGEATVLDYVHTTGLYYYVHGRNYLAGEFILDLPEWIVEPDSTKIIHGYSCKKANADYLGRKWEIWYSEDIPVNGGPWLLWGAPGLILDARDSEKLFLFKFTGVEPLSDDERRLFMEKYYPHRGEKTSYFQTSLKKAEALHTKYKTDSDYFLQEFGGLFSGKIKLPPYTPLIPTEYWKSKK